jgi:16S rRNA (guanine966-N2)-methyltransferase
LESLSGGLTGLAFLDLYAGSGAVGLEAASRGAAPVTLVERDQAAIKVIRDNVANTRIAGVEAARIEVVPLSVERYLAGAPQAHRVVFLDPPYAEPVDNALIALAGGGWLAGDAVVCVERATRDGSVSWPAGLAELRSRRYGDTTLWYGRAS